MAMALVPICLKAQSLSQVIDESTIDFASQYTSSILNPPATTVTITRQELDDWGAFTLDEALEHVPGIHVGRSSDGITGRVMIRGIDSNWILLRDGIIVGNTLRDVSTEFLHDIERIEIVKGSHFAIYNANVLSGTINIISKKPTLDGFEIGAIVGSNHAATTWGNYTKEIKDSGRFTLNYSIQDSDGPATRIEADRQSDIDEQLSTQNSLAPGAGHFGLKNIDLRFSYQNDSVLLRNYFNRREKGSGVGLFQSLDPTGEERVFRWVFEGRHRGNMFGGKFENLFLFDHGRGGYFDMTLLPSGTIGGLFPNGVQQSYELVVNSLTLESSWNREFNKHRLRVKVGSISDSSETKLDERNYTVQNGSPIPIPIGDLQEFTDEESIYGDAEEISFYGAFRDIWNVTDDLSLEAGLRIDNSDIFGTAINPRFSLDYKYDLRTDVTLLYGESTQVPTLNEYASNGLFVALGNRDIDYSKMRMSEFSISHTGYSRDSFRLNIYNYNQLDIIGTIADESSPNGLAFDNLPSGVSGNGFEVFYTRPIGNRIDVRIGWAGVVTRTMDTGSSKIARNQPYASLTYKTNSRISINGSYFGIWGRERRLDDDRSSLKDYNIFNVSIHAPVWKNTKASFTATNLFNDDAREDVSVSIPNDLRVFEREFRIGLESHW